MSNLMLTELEVILANVQPPKPVFKLNGSNQSNRFTNNGDFVFHDSVKDHPLVEHAKNFVSATLLDGKLVIHREHNESPSRIKNDIYYDLLGFLQKYMDNAEPTRTHLYKWLRKLQHRVLTDDLYNIWKYAMTCDRSDKRHTNNVVNLLRLIKERSDGK